MPCRVRPDLLALLFIGLLALPPPAWAGEKVRFVDLMSAESVPVASADNLHLFVDLIPGEPLTEEELGLYFGRGTPTTICSSCFDVFAEIELREQIQDARIELQQMKDMNRAASLAMRMHLRSRADALRASAAAHHIRVDAIRRDALRDAMRLRLDAMRRVR
jgi:hypothetical protein